ncbi:MAG: 2-amino-4-hydroxy-6-hydroxymethyldihydropteridine diphosphokinase [Candidatus Omnitrophica bacterium CG02_land_8_20_14_3_00__42_8]|nr:MAG: 2-amino-4-hydroxy-6-hydroxymethyldihydropteridine diphosphokinase [Candidatus Omnitrophica bacterium CG02_land_8_20_14_3_00__42_8]PIW67119.1 MAG: 2-amino-4-hydroxy-6-hydroxymethyldihydropteridine diphosphokinase [Candidatus Omnitrophica bacterium CG12_big_fil_rev_8_21_14_0_65_42_8]
MLCYIGVGSNLGDRKKHIEDAIEKLKNIEGVEVKRVSSIYETEPVGGPKQGKYLNGAIEIETGLGPREFLGKLQDIEKELGRKKTVKNGPRTIDLDILLYGDNKIDEPDLKIPHPNMREREFVMKPLKEIYEPSSSLWM